MQRARPPERTEQGSHTIELTGQKKTRNAPSVAVNEASNHTNVSSGRTISKLPPT